MNNSLQVILTYFYHIPEKGKGDTTEKLTTASLNLCLLKQKI